jgi:hypothetical protein
MDAFPNAKRSNALGHAQLRQIVRFQHARPFVQILHAQQQHVVL